MRLLALAVLVMTTVAPTGARGLRFDTVAQQELGVDGEATTGEATTADTGLRTISITGRGTVTATPDMATITVGVSTEALTAQEALAKNSENMTDVINVVKGVPFSVADEDIQTTGFGVGPRYEYDDKTRKSVLVGYWVNNNVVVKVRELELLGELLDRVVGSGGNQISGISFGIADTTEMIEDARKAAVTDARARVELYATAAEVSVGKVLAIYESGTSAPSMQYGDTIREAAGAAVPIEQGEQEVSASIHMIYELTTAAAE